MPDVPDVPQIRRATLDDIESLVRLRLALFREMGSLSSDSDAIACAYATRAYLRQKLPTGEFLAWVAEEGSAIVNTSGLTFFTRPLCRGIFQA